jgi:hypothetical protein
MIAMAQDFPSLRKKAEEIVKAKKPTWKLIIKQERDKEVSYMWGPEKADVRLTIFYGASKEEAAEKMNYSISHISVGPDKKLTNIGDEACLWTIPSGRFAAIRFRKANVYIDLSAPSLAMAEDLAISLAKLIQRN